MILAIISREKRELILTVLKVYFIKSDSYLFLREVTNKSIQFPYFLIQFKGKLLGFPLA